jgi:hypothetical protein
MLENRKAPLNCGAFFMGEIEKWGQAFGLRGGEKLGKIAKKVKNERGFG